MDDNKLLHRNIEVILDIMNEVKKHFGELSVVRGDKHTFLVMNIEINDNTIQVNMVKQLEDCIEIFGEGVSPFITSPATKTFFKVREDAKQLSEKKGEFFHSVVAKLLSIMNKSRSDLETAVSFFTMMVLNSDVDDW